jgi:hypothetical protein
MEAKILKSVETMEVNDLVPYYLSLKESEEREIDFADLFDLFMVAKVGKVAVDTLPFNQVERIYEFSKYLDNLIETHQIRGSLN